MSNTPNPQANGLDDRSGLTQAFNALWELATPEQREHFKQDEITPKRLSEAITEARIDELLHIPWKRADKYGINRPYITKQWYLDRLAQLKENK